MTVERGPWMPTEHDSTVAAVMLYGGKFGAVLNVSWAQHRENPGNHLVLISYSPLGEDGRPAFGPSASQRFVFTHPEE